MSTTWEAAVALALLILALVLGGIALLVEGLRWLLVVALVLLLLAAVTGGRGRTGRPPGTRT